MAESVRLATFVAWVRHTIGYSGNDRLEISKQPVSGKQRSRADLTPRELEILQLMLAGYTSRAIVKITAVGWETAEFHFDHLYAKLGVQTLMPGAEPREIPS